MSKKRVYVECGDRHVPVNEIEYEDDYFVVLHRRGRYELYSKLHDEWVGNWRTFDECWGAMSVVPTTVSDEGITVLPYSGNLRTPYAYFGLGVSSSGDRSVQQMGYPMGKIGPALMAHEIGHKTVNSRMARGELGGRESLVDSSGAGVLRREELAWEEAARSLRSAGEWSDDARDAAITGLSSYYEHRLGLSRSEADDRAFDFVEKL